MIPEWLAATIVVLYGASMLFLLLYSLLQAHLIFLFLRRYRREKKKIPRQLAEETSKLPFVTVQVPVYNEVHVISRLLQALAALRYPSDRLLIQILDDSTDETTQEIIRHLPLFERQGKTIQLIRRSHRNGFKAGALAHGFALSKGELIAVFDADFVPKPDFLLQIVPEFNDRAVGVVQARWTHLNADYSLLTRLQAFGLNAHFSIEQAGRNEGNFFINFNGTAGVWRRSCIESAGGWQSDTLTEDLDLSYRAQLAGWKFVYREDIHAPAELPVTMQALKSQQYRWNKGAAQCVRKNLGRVLRNKNLSLLSKAHAVFHLMNSTVFVAIMVAALCSIPLLAIKAAYPQWHGVMYAGSVFFLCFIIFFVFYYISFRYAPGSRQSPWEFVWQFFLFFVLSMGLSFHNARAVISGYTGQESAFERTPKYNIARSGQRWEGLLYAPRHRSRDKWIEGFCALYFLYGVVLAIRLHNHSMLPFLLMFFFGFAIIFAYHLAHERRALRFKSASA